MCIMSKFHIVKFLEENSVTVVPSSWVAGDMCAWPPFKGPKKIEDFVKARRAPKSSWQRVQVVIMKSTDSYDEAIKVEEKAIFTSDVVIKIEETEETEIEHTTKKKKTDTSDVVIKTEETEIEHTTRNKKKTDMYQGDISSDDEITHLPKFPPLKRRSVIATVSEQQLSPPCMPLNRTPEDTNDEIFKRKVLKMMENMQQSLNEVHEMLKSSRCPLPSLPPSCPKLPCENPEDLIQLEALLEDENAFNTICDYLSTIGGSSVKDCTRRLLNKLISNNLSLKYNWKGTRGIKLAFSTFSFINKLILGSVRNNLLCTKATEVEVNDVIKKWLMHAKDREGGRNVHLLIN